MRTVVARGRNGFTLIELLVVISIIALLIGILLPTLGGAKRAALDLIGQINQKQIGLATALYFDDQPEGKQRFFDLFPYLPGKEVNPVTGSHDFRAHREIVIRELHDYIDAAEEVFVCPLAIGASSVLDEQTRLSMESGGRVQVSDFDQDGHEEFTEYWFNDSLESQLPTTDPDYTTGVSGQFLRVIPHPEEVVWAIDAVDWIPRHKKPAIRDEVGLNVEGSSHLLFGDGRVELMAEIEYILKRDKFNSAPIFFNWGHFYPDD